MNKIDVLVEAIDHCGELMEMTSQPQVVLINYLASMIIKERKEKEFYQRVYEQTANRLNR